MKPSSRLDPRLKPVQVNNRMIEQFTRLFVNRRMYSVQCKDESGQYQYFRRKTPLGPKVVAAHLKGYITIALYSINPQTQRTKWLAIDADYDNAWADLQRLQLQLKEDGMASALEHSRRGGHLWMFYADPVPAALCRLYIYNIAVRLNIPIKQGGQPGLEIFPRQDQLRPDQYGHAIRAPLGVHRKVMERYWFEGTKTTLSAQLQFLWNFPKITEARLLERTKGMTFPEKYLPPPPDTGQPKGDPSQWFRITDYVRDLRTVGSVQKGRCPSCAAHGNDRTGDNLVVWSPHRYKCFAGCTKEEIRTVLGRPIRRPAAGAVPRTSVRSL